MEYMIFLPSHRGDIWYRGPIDHRQDFLSVICIHWHLRAHGWFFLCRTVVFNHHSHYLLLRAHYACYLQHRQRNNSYEAWKTTTVSLIV
ncbi:hypothetical protein BDV33DRAFT_180393 [Aspergillus novoparasiticus]|uniref:Uncharacterized protein n=1 Tax=Aspergillus novoparasiticus TaxID=986946 RepID=A0A5N6EDP5_9EURO|nr:hypothetical protein BDV33DRAFT_180393 [Aspergillus novoparasiticus]